MLVTQSCSTLCDPMECSPPAPLSMGFSRQEYWSGLPFPYPGDLPDPGIEPGSLLHCRQILYHLSYGEVHALAYSWSGLTSVIGRVGGNSPVVLFESVMCLCSQNLIWDFKASFKYLIPH